MPKFRVNLTETVTYAEVVVEAKNVFEAEQKQTEMIDNNELEIVMREDTDYRVDEEVE